METHGLIMVSRNITNGSVNSTIRDSGVVNINQSLPSWNKGQIIFIKIYMDPRSIE